jgi:hypothetical protein
MSKFTKPLAIARAWVRASRAYNIDCNMRVLKKPDAKRKKLRAKSEETFSALMKTLKAII